MNSKLVFAIVFFLMIPSSQILRRDNNGIKKSGDILMNQWEQAVFDPATMDQYEKLDKVTRALIQEKSLNGVLPNRLIFEKSPYLLQHAFNPVHWFPWGEEAFRKAKKEGKPIFLSIGYSTCYWCHVMEREIFENPEFAELLNNYFVSIKIDREDRPDLDRIYMGALVAMTGAGGWPMSLFLTPDLKPFFAATYIPPVASYGKPGFPDLVEKIHEVWTNSPDRLFEVGERLIGALGRAGKTANPAGILNEEVLKRGFEYYPASYDSHYGGFDPGPKFPRPVNFNFLLRYYKRTGEKAALEMTLKTLREMAQGGMYDHLGGGFHRYSVDREWRVPHFEKMLYDQAQLASSYTDAFQITKDPFFKGIAVDVLEYVLREMTFREGGFFSAEDAESAPDPSFPEKKEEGSYYLWTHEDFGEVLGDRDAGILRFYYGVLENGNVASDPLNTFTGKNILYIAHSLQEVADQFSLTLEAVIGIVGNAKEKMLVFRSSRLPPYKDDKILVSWNGLMISAMARVYQVTGDSRFLEAAQKAGEFIEERLFDAAGKKLLRRYRGGEALHVAQLQDYALFVQGLLDLYEASAEYHWLEFAISLTHIQNRLFYDTENGGFYETTGADKSVILRLKDRYDGVKPTGNSVAMMNLLRLFQVTENGEWKKMVEQSLSYFSHDILNSPQGMPQFLSVVDFSLKKQKQIVIAGDPEKEDTRALFQEIYSHYLPNKVVLFADGGEGQQKLGAFVPFFKSVGMVDGKATAYVCEDFRCDYPTTERKAFAMALKR